MLLKRHMLLSICRSAQAKLSWLAAASRALSQLETIRAPEESAFLAPPLPSRAPSSRR